MNFRSPLIFERSEFLKNNDSFDFSKNYFKFSHFNKELYSRNNVFDTLIFTERCTSTQNLLAHHLDKLEGNIIFVTEEQTEGKGQFSLSFFEFFQNKK